MDELVLRKLSSVAQVQAALKRPIVQSKMLPTSVRCR